MLDVLFKEKNVAESEFKMSAKNVIDAAQIVLL